MDKPVRLHLESVVARATLLLEWDNATDQRRQELADTLTRILEAQCEEEAKQGYLPHTDELAYAWAANDGVSNIAYGNLDQLDMYESGYDLFDNGMCDKLLDVYSEYCN